MGFQDWEKRDEEYEKLSQEEKDIHHIVSKLINSSMLDREISFLVATKMKQLITDNIEFISKSLSEDMVDEMVYRLTASSSLESAISIKIDSFLKRGQKVRDESIINRTLSLLEDIKISTLPEHLKQNVKETLLSIYVEKNKDWNEDGKE